MFLCAECHLSVSSVYTAHSSNNKGGGDKRSQEEKRQTKEFVLILDSFLIEAVLNRHVSSLTCYFSTAVSEVV